MSDSFNAALTAASHERLQKAAEAEAAKNDRLREMEERRRAARLVFEELKGLVGSKDAEIERFGFRRGEIVDAERNDYRVTLTREGRIIAIQRIQTGFRAYMWWDHVRTDGFIEPFDSTDVNSEDDLMSLLGRWVGQYGEEIK